MHYYPTNKKAIQAAIQYNKIHKTRKCVVLQNPFGFYLKTFKNKSMRRR